MTVFLIHCFRHGGKISIFHFKCAFFFVWLCLCQQAAAFSFCFVTFFFHIYILFRIHAPRNGECSRWINFYLYFIVISCSSNIFHDPHEFQMHVCFSVEKFSNRSMIHVTSNLRKTTSIPSTVFIIYHRSAFVDCVHFFFSNVIFNSMQIYSTSSIVARPKMSNYFEFLNNDLLHWFIRKMLHKMHQSEFQCQLKLSIWFYLRVCVCVWLKTSLNP